MLLLEARVEASGDKGAGGICPESTKREGCMMTSYEFGSKVATVVVQLLNGYLEVLEGFSLMNGNQELTAPRSLANQVEPSHWDVCSC
jgi:hypothetical protein